MTQFTDQHQVETTKRVAGKLQAFYDDLTEDEQWALDLAVRRLIARADEPDTQGQMINHNDLVPRPLVPPPGRGGGGLIIPTLFNDTSYDPDWNTTSPVNPPGP